MDGTVSYVREFAERSQCRMECITTVTFEENSLAMASETTMLSQYTQTPSKSWATKCSHTTSNFLKDFPTLISALIAETEQDEANGATERDGAQLHRHTDRVGHEEHRHPDEPGGGATATAYQVCHIIQFWSADIPI